MNISKTYQPGEAEEKWYNYWLEHGFFKSVPDEREPYTIVIPPPNVTGVLHMGHMLNNTIQDVLIRRARMKGKNACWVPGTDHASIATEAKVVAMLKERGIAKTDLTRPEFMTYAWEWKEKYGGIILEQLKKLGASCDWDRTRFTMEDDMSEAVIDTFIQLYNSGLIYRGIRMVNWDPVGKTAVSDEEVIRKEVNQKLYYVRYRLADSNDKVNEKAKKTKENEQALYVTVATTRPETIMADVAIFVNPKDRRYTHLHGKKVSIPLINKEIPVLTDEYVTMDFGTGCLKVTPAHDLNDYQLAQKHNLPVIDILNDDGTLNKNARILIGEDRFAARKKIAVLLETANLLEKVEDYKSQIGFSERTDAVIEPKLSMQWFCKMEEMAKPALDYVLKGEIKLIPDKFINTYRHWMENVKDWCISRQLWWGQQIPAWYLPDGQYVIAKTRDEAFEHAKSLTYEGDLESYDLNQDEDVLDTWFSSWLWPISVFDGFKNPNNADINYYYPTNDLVTAPEILFFWVARMIMAGHEFRGQIPFKNVYLTGIVRDKLGRKMSKSLGNSPDPLDLIEKYGADGVRTGMLRSSPAGNDLMFDEAHCEWGRNFANKIWNAFKLVNGFTVDKKLKGSNTVAIQWFENRFNQALTEIEGYFAEYRISDALMTTYKLVWDDFCAWYLEMIKPGFVDGEALPIDKETHASTIKFFENILKILHPFMPFITEELWHEELFGKRETYDCCIVATMPIIGNVDTALLADVDNLQQIITQLRSVRKSKQIADKVQIALAIKSNSAIPYNKYEAILNKLGNLNELSYVSDKIAGAANFMVSTDEFFIPLSETVDPVEEIKRLEKEKEYLTGFLNSVNLKLNNERFMANAKPEVIDFELKKKADAEAKLRILEESLTALAN
jgi:valyl-tRNA synthetase